MDMWFAFALSKNGAPKQKDRMAFVGFLLTCRICGEGKNNAHTVFVDMVGGFPDVRQDHIEFSKSPPEKETGVCLNAESLLRRCAQVERKEKNFLASKTAALFP